MNNHIIRALLVDHQFFFHFIQLLVKAETLKYTKVVETQNVVTLCTDDQLIHGLWPGYSLN